MCVLRSVVQPTLSSLYWARVIRRGRRFFSSSSSYASSRTRAENAMRVPSGDHASSPASSFRSVSRIGSPPSAGITYTCFLSRSRLDAKASFVPSGDQRGVVSDLRPAVKRRGGAEPSDGTSQIELLYAFSSRSIEDTVTATVLPSGETLGSPAHVN